MAEDSKIEWTDHTFNPWIGCTKVSPACDHCYAERWADRYGAVKWGPGQERRRTSRENWTQVRRWNRQAQAAGSRTRVFCASLADWADSEVPEDWRSDLFELIEETEHLDWLLLTKRHSLVERHLPERPWRHVRIGMTVENRTMAQARLPRLARLGLLGWQTFVSYEPALGAVPWWPWLDPDGIAGGAIGWVICGGESGSGARAMRPAWAREAKDACVAAGVPFFMKQVGSNHEGWPGRVTGKGDEPEEWPAFLRLRQFPQVGV